MKALLNFARIFVGVLFIFSGLVKANDPLGLSYKMQEFFEVWGMHFLNDYTLAFSVAMIAFEIIAGVAVLVGWQMRLFSWLLLLLIVFFTFLTGYAVLSGNIKECGCFGNCIPLTSWQSFIKDLILLALILFIFFNKDKVRPYFTNGVSISSLALSGIFSFALMFYTLSHLPIVDCLPYKVGVNILGSMKIPEGATPDSTVITFVYQHQGREIEFTADQFPADFNDSTYAFIRRYDKVVRQGNALPAIKDFALTNLQGEPVTDTILNREGYKLLLFLKQGYSKGDWTTLADITAREAASRGISCWLVTSIPADELSEGEQSLLNRFEIVQCDVTAIKTAARANPTLFLLNRDTILKKWSYADIDKALREVLSLQKK